MQDFRSDRSPGRRGARRQPHQPLIDGLRLHQSIGRVPVERFKVAVAPDPPVLAVEADTDGEPAVTSRRVGAKGIGFATGTYKAGAWLAGQTVEVRCDGGLVQLWHRGVLVAPHARRHPPDS